MTSEVGSGSATENMEDNESNNPWKELFGQQNRQFMAILNAFRANESSNITLPEFDPHGKNVDPKAWITMAEMCIGTKTLPTSDLMIILNNALKGEASTWLSQVSYPNMSWADFRETFTARFDATETTAAAVIRMLESKPKENDSCVSYASSWLTGILTRFQDLSKEEIAVAVTMAHVSKFTPKIRRITFTTEVRSRHKMQQELNAIHEEPEVKKFRPGTPPPVVKCFVCGKRGHKAAVCIERQRGANLPPVSATPNKTYTNPKIVCFKCNQVGHIASKCTERSNMTTNNKDQDQRRVNICEVGMATGSLHHNGAPYQYQYDSGSECSLVKE